MYAKKLTSNSRLNPFKSVATQCLHLYSMHHQFTKIYGWLVIQPYLKCSPGPLES